MTDPTLAIDVEGDLAKIGVVPALQARSRTLRDALIREGLAIARRTSFDAVSIHDICAAAGCSTGAFYSRFPDKATLFKAVMVFAAAESGPMLESIVATAPFGDIMPRLMRAQVDRYVEQATFFRSAFRVSLEASEAWEPFRRNAHNLASAYIVRLRGEANVDPSSIDVDRVRFAFQIMYALLNNTLINSPGPFFLESPQFPALMENAVLGAMGVTQIVAQG
ncbi:TetR/AcrR family transcriptional regulator [Novosphingobium rosa]|uniref:TetR/AcrR family transcriptional regulator n=1 Tax=Novosphingobium rosa TaxID=76978 RepID=UPI0008295CCC|nr:TetR/AcrR family transcriptional regulator [Novosphingobium rosa]